METFEFGITRDFLDEGRIVVFTSAGDMRRAAVDVWFEVVKQTYASWLPGKPLFVLHDLSAPGNAMTPYLRQKAYALYEIDLAHIPAGRIAVAAPDTLLMRLMAILLRERDKRFRRNAQRIFASRGDALRWLREQRTIVEREFVPVNPFATLSEAQR
ncbi:MAG TPA: hypothetical protein PLD47_11940 [Aggregatilineales bacterium]|nr:hypothetical protein [Anaerolineales bacterium]HRE48426.1 hypothetical protein [Aggregatilineales bacterium]